MRPHPNTATPRTQDRDLVVYDGREAVGWIRRFTDVFVAYDAGGKLLGRFADQRAATRAIPTSRKTASARNGRSRAGRGAF